MRQGGPFQRSDLMELGEFFASTAGIVSMREVYEGNRDHRVVGLRHDVDNHSKALETAVEMAKWEHENGWRSTYFLLHTARYWRDGRWRDAAATIASLGHELGFHADAIGYCLAHGGDPHELTCEVLAEFRAEGHEIIGVVGHGNQIAYKVEFANDEQFVECVRPQLGEPNRELSYNGRTLKLDPRPLADYGLEYEAIGLRQYEYHDGQMRTRPNQLYNTDSGKAWFYPFEDTIAAYRRLKDGQLHLLVHPDHWHEAFVREAVA